MKQKRHHQTVREYYQVLPYGKEARRAAIRTILRAVRTMENPADIINAAIDELVKQRYEMPAFSTLDRLVKRIRALVYERMFRIVARHITPEAQQIFEMLLDAQTPLHHSYFSLLKRAPPSPTLSHLKASRRYPYPENSRIISSMRSRSAVSSSSSSGFAICS